jgi:glycosyltransferase involved in cell wall biosynthesis
VVDEQGEPFHMNTAVIESRVIPNGIDLSYSIALIEKKARQELNLPEDAWIFLFVAHGLRSNPVKDYATVRAAFWDFVKLFPKEKIILIGLGEKGKEERRESGVIRFVEYQKNIANVAKYYNAADLYLHAAFSDNFPTSVLEALACGIPVVATAVGAFANKWMEETGF